MNEKKKPEIRKFLEFAMDVVKESERISLKYFSRKISVKIKSNNTPVTEADLRCEDYILRKIKNNYPGHSIYSEEKGEKDNHSEFKWIIDPIDGTKNYIRGIPFWGTLVTLEYCGKIITGVIHMPVLKETIYAGKSIGCYVNGKRTYVSKIKSLKDSYLIHGGYKYIYKKNKVNIKRLIIAAAYNRGFGDCHGHSLIIKGFADAMIDPTPAAYDLAATKICIEEAGGKLTDFRGNDSIYDGNAIISNGRVHNEIIGYMSR